MLSLGGPEVMRSQADLGSYVPPETSAHLSKDS